jgi:hypothetical protein
MRKCSAFLRDIFTVGLSVIVVQVIEFSSREHSGVIDSDYRTINLGRYSRNGYKKREMVNFKCP